MLSPTMAGLAAAGILSGCASQPQRNDQLEQARTDVHSLEQDPDAQAAAQQQLRDAHADLQRADDALDKHRSSDEVTHLAYLADREADAGKALADEYRARQQLAKAGEERSHIQLEGRTEEAQRANEQAQNAREEAQRAQTELQKEQQELSELKTRQTQRGVELTLASDLLFNTGSAELKPGATLQISRLADFMRSNPKARVIVEGYTDSTGTAAHNEQLSQERAQAVASALETQGIMMDRIQTVGRGQDYPVASNDSSAGRQQNRRVDVILSDESGRFAQGATQGPVVR
jgi:outer membrane protein OmpA-like peptidoglycan-associated protein